MRELAVCEVCSRVFPATMMQGRSCPHCAKPIPTPPKVDFYALADDGEQPVDRICKDCGAHFIGNRRCRYCHSCRDRRNRESDIRHRERRKDARNQPRPEHPVCAQCGKPLPDTRRKFCSECALARQDARNAAYRHQHKAEINAAQRAKYHAKKEAQAK